MDAGLDLIPWRGDRFIPALRASAGTRQACALPEQKAAILASGELQHEPAGAVARDRFHDVTEVVLYLPLADARQLGQLSRRPECAGEEVHDPLAHSLFRSQHLDER